VAEVRILLDPGDDMQVSVRVLERHDPARGQVIVHRGRPHRRAAGGGRDAGAGGRTEEAISWLRSRAEAGHVGALVEAALLLRRAGRTGEAISWLRSRAEAGLPGALGAVALLLRRAGRTEEAITFCQRAADAGETVALENAARLLEEAGRTEEAVRLRRYGLEPGGRIADPWEASVLA
jgi:TPR repeat protein